MFKHSLVIAAAFVASALGVQTARADDYQALAKSLASLRAEVEGLSTSLSERRTDLRDELRSYARQKSEMAATLDREKMRLQKIRISIAQRKKEIDAQIERSRALLPTFERVAKITKDYIRGSLPFRVEERLAEVTAVEGQLHAGLLTPQKAVARVWTVLEDEFRMARENGLYRQTIEVDGREQLADVVRIGMVTLYYRTGDGAVGYALKSDGAWGYAPLSDPEARKRVDYLFDSFKKQIRVGFFELPGTGGLLVEP